MDVTAPGAAGQHGRRRRATTDWWDSAVAALLAAPAVLVPVIVTANILWARAEFAVLHPGYVARRPATVSRAITDPAIGEAFALWIALAALLLAFASWRIAKLYGALLASQATRRQGLAKIGIIAFALAQAGTVASVVLLSQFTLANGHDLHMAASYVFFAAQSVGILISGLLSALLLHTGDRHPIFARIARLQLYGAIAIVLQALGFLALFVLKDVVTTIDRYTILQVYCWIEVSLIMSFLAYLASFAPPLYRHERAARRARQAVRASSPVSIDTMRPASILMQRSQR